MRPVFCLAAIFFFGSNLFAQYGPGGVGDSTQNVLWLRADRGTSTTTPGAAISQWNDQSRNSNHVSQATANQQPLFQTNILNGYPAIEFDNVTTTNDFLEGADSPTLDNTNGLTILSVVRPTALNGNARTIVGKRVNVGVNQSYMFFFFSSNYLYADVVSNNNRFSTSPTAFASNNNYILDLWYDGTLASASRCRIYSNQSLLVTAAEGSASIPDFASPLVVGATHTTDNRPFGGYMAEVIIYRIALNSAQRIIVDNYLSAKYDIALAVNDVYVQDDVANGNFDHDVAGIGRVDASNIHNDAQGSGILRINNPTNLNDDEFLLWGHDNGGATATEMIDVPAGVDARLDRIWRFSEVNSSGTAADVGAVDVMWDLTGLGSVSASDLRLLIDSDNDGSFADEIAVGGAALVSGNVYSFSGVTGIQDGIQISLGTSNVSQTPLPVSLLSWNAKRLNQNSVELKWQTASESNSDRFIVECSTDLETWWVIESIDAAGSSAQLREYKTIDDHSSSGKCYYRLTQIDVDGTSTVYAIRVVDAWSNNDHDIHIFPSPADDQITVSCASLCDCDVVITDAIGHNVSHLVEVTHSEEGLLSINIYQLPSGWYVLQCDSFVGRFVKTN